MKTLIFLTPFALGIFSGVVSPAAGDTCQYVPADIEYLFYSLKNPTSPIIVPSNNFNAIKNTHFDKTKSTLLLVHGSGGNSSGPLVQTVRDTVVKAKLNVNVIGVEWRRFQIRNPNVRNCEKLFGTIVGNFAKELSKSHGLNYNNLVIVGHSIAGGFCGEVGEALGGQVKSIVGLETCCQKKYAKFVECIHTGNANYSAMAHANYYPNGGGQQPHCPQPPDWACNHWRVIDYYAESLTTTKFVARQCDTYAHFKAGKCNKNPTGIMGGVLPHTSSGIFYLDTNDVPPYAKG